MILIKADNGKSSHDWISPVVDLKNESVEIFEVKDTKGSDGSIGCVIAFDFFDFRVLEEENFGALDFR